MRPIHRLFSITLTSIVLSGVTLPTYADLRQEVWLSADEREVILIEMRNFLKGSQQVLEASLEEDMIRVSQTARPLGVKMMKVLPKSLIQKMPVPFAAMFKTLHYGFEEIADMSQSPNGNSKIVLKKLASMQNSCVGCHATYQLKIK